MFSRSWSFHLIWLVFFLLILWALAALSGRGQVRSVGPQLICNIEAYDNPNGTVWVVHRLKAVNGVETVREPVVTVKGRKRALRACEDYLDGKPVKPAVQIKRRLR
jgi:hypothetical protein